MADYASTARSTYDAWNARDFDRFAELLANAEIVIVGSGATMRGSEGARQFAEMWETAFPDGRVQIDSVTEGDGRVVVEFTGRGTQTGPLRTPMGEFDATGKPLTLSFCDVWTFASDGTPKQLKTYFDSAAMMTQLGLMPQMAGAGTTA